MVTNVFFNGYLWTAGKKSVKRKWKSSAWSGVMSESVWNFSRLNVNKGGAFVFEVLLGARLRGMFVADDLGIQSLVQITSV